MNLELRRAEHALKVIKKEEARGIDDIKSVDGTADVDGYRNYRSHCEGLPATILINGLGQALAMQLAKADKQKEKKRLYEAVSNWVSKEVYGQQSDLLDYITKGNQNQYVQAHAETLAYLAWLKKFAAAFLEKPNGGG